LSLHNTPATTETYTLSLHDALPILTEERRKEMVKHLHKVLEEDRTAVRNIRRDGNEAIKKAMKDKKISEDDEKRSLEEIQKLTEDRKSTRLNSSHVAISYAVFCLKK